MSRASSESEAKEKMKYVGFKLLDMVQEAGHPLKAIMAASLTLGYLQMQVDFNQEEIESEGFEKDKEVIALTKLAMESSRSMELSKLSEKGACKWFDYEPDEESVPSVMNLDAVTHLSQKIHRMILSYYELDTLGELVDIVGIVTSVIRSIECQENLNDEVIDTVIEEMIVTGAPKLAQAVENEEGLEYDYGAWKGMDIVKVSEAAKEAVEILVNRCDNPIAAIFAILLAFRTLEVEVDTGGNEDLMGLLQTLIYDLEPIDQAFEGIEWEQDIKGGKKDGVVSVAVKLEERELGPLQNLFMPIVVEPFDELKDVLGVLALSMREIALSVGMGEPNLVEIVDSLYGSIEENVPQRKKRELSFGDMEVVGGDGKPTIH